jgi:hypothetical protein
LPKHGKISLQQLSKARSLKGGSEIGERLVGGDWEAAKLTLHVVGYRRFFSDDKQKISDLLEKHPVIIHGGSAELCEMPKS